MARRWQVLTVAKIKAEKRVGYHADGAHLYLRVLPSGRKQWAFRYQRHKQRHETTLGGFPDVGLQKARQIAAEWRELLRQGIDPIDERRRRRAAGARGVTFQQVAEDYLRAKRPEWSNEKHAKQWESTLRRTYPAIGHVPIEAVETSHILSVLKPIWFKTPDSARRLQQRLENVLAFAKAHHLRQGENPAAWRYHLETILARPARRGEQQHLESIPYVELPLLMAQLQQRGTLAADALRFCVLTASRSGEVLGARWDEIANGTWTVPAARMKAGREHVVPLSKPAADIIAGLPRVSRYVFPGRSLKLPLSGPSMLRELRALGRSETVHGMRASFRTWAQEQTNVAGEVVETALAHVNADRVEAAYARSNLLDKRRQLMQAWADFLVKARAEP